MINNQPTLRKKCPYLELLYGLVFSAFGLNTERYFISLHIQSEYGKMRTRTTPNTDTFHAMQVLTIKSVIAKFFIFFLLNMDFLVTYYLYIFYWLILLFYRMHFIGFVCAYNGTPTIKIFDGKLQLFYIFTWANFHVHVPYQNFIVVSCSFS